MIVGQLFFFIRKSRSTVFANWVRSQHSILFLSLEKFFNTLLLIDHKHTSRYTILNEHIESTYRDRPNDDYTKMYLNSPVGIVGFVIQNFNFARSTSGKKNVREKYFSTLKFFVCGDLRKSSICRSNCRQWIFNDRKSTMGRKEIKSEINSVRLFKIASWLTLPAFGREIIKEFFVWRKSK